MEPIKRFVSTITEGNLWIYILSLGLEREIQDKEVASLIFERFGFLPNDLLVKRVLFRLRADGYIKTEKFKGEKAFKTTEAGKKELEGMKKYSGELLQKL